MHNIRRKNTKLNTTVISTDPNTFRFPEVIVKDEDLNGQVPSCGYKILVFPQASLHVSRHWFRMQVVSEMLSNVDRRSQKQYIHVQPMRSLT